MSFESLVGLISGSGGALGVILVWLTLILAGKEHTNSEFERERERGDKLEEANEELQRALTAANARAEAAVRATEVIADAFRSRGSRR